MLSLLVATSFLVLFVGSGVWAVARADWLQVAVNIGFAGLAISFLIRLGRARRDEAKP